MKTLWIAMIGTICTLGLATGALADIPTSGLVSYWQADDNALDAFGNNDGTVNGATFTSGQYGQAFHFNGNDQNIEIAHATELQPSSITVGAWIRTGSTTGLRMIADKSHGLGNSGWALQLNAGRIAWASGDGSGFPQLDGTVMVADNTFHHIAVTLDESTDEMRLYVDGVDDGMLSFTGTQLGNDRPVNFGAWWEQSLNSQYGREFVGDIDDIAIYNRALNQTEIVQLMTQSVPEPGSGLLMSMGMLLIASQRRRKRN